MNRGIFTSYKLAIDAFSVHLTQFTNILYLGAFRKHATWIPMTNFELITIILRNSIPSPKSGIFVISHLSDWRV